MKNYPKNIIIHHSGVSYSKNPNQFQAIDKYHRDKGWGGIGYHYLIEKDGTVMSGRPENESGAHTKQSMMNYFSIGICFTGNFDMEEPTEEQKLSALTLIKRIQSKYTIRNKNVFPHRHFATYKSCWGSKVPNDVLGYLAIPNEEKPSEWAEKYWEEAIRSGITSGKRPRDNITREEAVTMIMRALSSNR